MFFAVSKLLAFFTAPSNLALVTGLVGVMLLMTRYRRLAIRFLACGTIALAVFGLSPFGSIMLLTLSERFPPWVDDGIPPDGIIVLGGAMDPDVSAARSSVELTGAAERMTSGAVLARRFPAAKLVFSGGNADLVGGSSRSESADAIDLWTSLGIPRDRIIVEDRSRNTIENAIFTRDLIHPKAGERWLLVTSAYHMPRSVAVFRAAGFPVVPYPVDWRTRGWHDAWVPFELLSRGLPNTDAAFHEWIGLITYRLTGRTKELLPGPN
jgi:uncharacterized SAM-binding protein YcdF (DUF218 family)